jgi:hypothetical protein
MAGRGSDGRVRLMIDFDGEESLADFVTMAKDAGLIPDNFGVYEAESLDFAARSGGIGRAGTYIALSVGDGRKRLYVARSEPV